MNGATIVSLLSPLVAVGIAVWGFRRASRADRLRAFFDLQERYLALEIREGRKLVHQVVAGRGADEASALAEDLAAKISRTLAVMNSIAIACEGRFVDKTLVAEGMGRSFAAAVLAAKPYIDHLESVRGFRPFPFAERLAADLLRKGYVVGARA